MRLKMSRLMLLFFLAFCSYAEQKPAPKASSRPDAHLANIVTKLQTAWDAAKSYKTTFKQVIFSKRFGSRDESEGTLFVIKPDRLRWETKGDGSFQILHGKKLTVVQPNPRRENRVVDIHKDVSKSIDAKPLAFLAGKAKFKEVYNIKLDSETPQLATLKLTPKGSGSETFVAEIDKTSYLLRSLTTETADSRVRIEFSAIETNPQLDDKLFEFKPGPKDIIHNQ